MLQVTILVIVLTLVANTHQVQDYCSRNLCNGHHHIACRNSGQFASVCQNPKHVAITPAIKNLILFEHNTYRNLIASGRQKRYASASKMPILKWSNELAHFAKLNVLQCRMKHDECRNTESYKFCGQNLGIQQSNLEISIISTVTSLIKAWYEEHTKATMTDINKFRGYNLHSIGHFTTMIQDKATEVGCAIAKYKLGDVNNLLLACDYSYTNIIGVPVYKKGRSCTSCSTGCDRNFKALCSSNEKVIPKP